MTYRGSGRCFTEEILPPGRYQKKISAMSTLVPNASTKRNPKEEAPMKTISKFKSYLMEGITMDIMGPLVETRKGNKYIL